MFMGCIVVGYAHAQEVGVCVDWSIFVGRLARRASSFVSLDIYPHPTSWLSLLGFGCETSPRQYTQGLLYFPPPPPPRL